MVTERRPVRTRWYHHVLIVAIAVAVGLFFYFVRPSVETQWIIFAVAVFGVVAIVTARWIEKRRSAPRPRDGG